jgi:RNA-directed DNA polymerase
LTLRNLTDRIAATALNNALTPVWEPAFAPWSMGFRPGRGVHRLLAELEAVVTLEGRWVLAVDDVKKAFDNVIINDVLADHLHYVRDDRLLALIDRVLRGGDDNKSVGIDQGSAYSPTALNVRLHHAHDRHIDGSTVTPPRPLRYADNLAYLCRSVSEGRQAMAQSQKLLEAAGFTLKGEDGPPVDLRQGGHVQLLGFSLSHENEKLTYKLGRDAWVKLDQNLSKAHEADDPTTAARVAVRGWIDAYGPAFENRRDDVLNRVLTTAAGCGFREIDDRETLQGRWKSAWGRWRFLCHEVRHGSQRASGSFMAG